MKKVFLILPIFLLTTASVFSQDQKQVGVGIGTTLNFNPGTIFGQSVQTIRIPVNLTENFRVEPYLGLFGSDQENSNKLAPGIKDERKYSAVLLGSGFYFLIPQESGNFYLGINAGKYFYEDEGKYNESGEIIKETTEGSGWMFSPTVGGEYYFSSSFCLGLEAGLSIMNDETTEKISSYANYEETIKENTLLSFTTLTVKYFIF